MQKYRLGLYEKAMPAQLSWPEKLCAAREAGFDWLEMSIDETDEKQERLDWREGDIRRLEADMQAAGCPMDTMCLSGHRKYPLGAHSAEVRAQSLVIMQKAVDLAARLGIKIIQLAGYDVYYEEGDETTRAFFAENLEKCVDMASARGVLLGFETMETPFMDTVGKAMHYVRLVRSPYLGVYPDIGNLTNAAVLYGHSLPEDVKTGGGHILAAHLKETRPGIYRDLTFGEGHTDYVPAVRQLYGMGVRMFTGEFWYDGSEDWRGALRGASAFLRQKIEMALAMAEKGETACN